VLATLLWQQLSYLDSCSSHVSWQHIHIIWLLLLLLLPDDLLNGQLTVEETLAYTAKLRCPHHFSDSQRQAKVEQVGAGQEWAAAVACAEYPRSASIGPTKLPTCLDSCVGIL
jgi:hypothetical protein